LSNSSKPRKLQAGEHLGNPSQVAAKQQELKALQKKVNQLQFSLGYE
jgi:hypothetical protein